MASRKRSRKTTAEKAVKVTKPKPRPISPIGGGQGGILGGPSSGGLQ